jgi:hypothetical protein
MWQVHAQNINNIFLELRDIFKNRTATAVIEQDVYKTVLQRAGWALPGPFSYIYFLNKKIVFEFRNGALKCAVPWLKKFGLGFSPWSLGFDPRRFIVRFVVDEVALRQVFLRVYSGLPCYSSFHHCSILIHQRPLRCAIALTTQHSITSSVFKLRTSSLTQNFGWLQSNVYQVSFR